MFRRRYYAVLLAVLGLCAMAAGCQRRAASQDWPTVQVDPYGMYRLEGDPSGHFQQ